MNHEPDVLEPITKPTPSKPIVEPLPDDSPWVLPAPHPKIRPTPKGFLKH